MGYSSDADPGPVASGPFCWDPDPAPSKGPRLNLFGVGKSHKTIRNPCC
jgi:hypothetical protein